MANQLPKRIFRTQEPKKVNQVLCIGCGEKVTPGLCDTGSIIEGLQFRTLKTMERTPVLGVIECALSDKAHVIGGDLVEKDRKVGFFRRRRGTLCSSCASNYHCLEDKYGRKHPMVMIDAKSDFRGSTVLPRWEPPQQGVQKEEGPSRNRKVTKHG